MKDRKKKRGKLERKLILSMVIIFLIVIISTVGTVFWGFFEERVDKTKEELVNISSFWLSVLMRSPEDSGNMTLNELMELYKSNADYGSTIDSWLENGPDKYYEDAYDQICDMMESYPRLSDMFMYQPVLDENGELTDEMVIIFDAPTRNETELKLGDRFRTKALDTIKKVIETHETQVYDQTAYNNEAGFILVAFSPIFYDDGTICAIGGVEADIKGIIVSVLSEKAFLIIDAVVNFWIFGIVVFIFIKKSIVKPVGIISGHMNKFVSSEGTLTFDPITEIHTKDEIEQIADDFNSLAQRTIEFTKNLELKTVTQERLRLDLDVAGQIRSIVSTEPVYPAFPERNDFDLYASLKHTMYNKCSFCNYFFTDQNHITLIMGESLGDDLASMIFAILSVAYIKCFAKMGYEPYRIAFETNNQLCSVEKKDKGLTVGVIIADIDLKTGVMKYTNAGMPPLLIKKAGEDFACDKANVPFTLGQMRGISFEQNVLTLSQGNTVIFSSYGVSDMCDPFGNKYTAERLCNTVNTISGNTFALNEVIDELEETLEKFRDGAEVTADTAILGFRYFG